MVPLVVQADPLVGTDAFWMTRPIPWRALLAAKVIPLWVFIAAVPVVAEAAAMVAYHVPIWPWCGLSRRTSSIRRSG